MKKKKFTPRYREANERPLFAPYNAVHETAKDKANKRSAKKLALKKELQRED